MRMCGYMIQRLYIAFYPKLTVKSCLVPWTPPISIYRSLNLSRKRWNLDRTSQQTDSEKGGQDYAFNEAHPYLEVYPKITKGYLNEEFIRGLVANVVGCSEETAQTLYQHYPQIKEIHAVTFIETFQYFKDKGVDRDIVLNNFELLFESLTSIKRKFDLISQIGIKEDTVALMNLGLSQLENVVKGWHINETVNGVTYTNRLDYVRNTIGCNMQQLLSQPNILTGHFRLIKKKLKLLYDHGITREDICQTLGLFRISVDKLEYRLKKATFANIGPVKCWMLMRKNDSFENMISDWKDLGDGLKSEDDVESYLIKRLECSKDYIEYVKFCNPQLSKLHVQQVKIVLDFIFSLGFTPNDVCNTPKVLFNTIERLQRGYEKLVELGLKPTNIYHLTLRTAELKQLAEQQQQKSVNK